MNTSRQPGLQAEENAAESAEMESAEAKMRRALGLSGGARQSAGLSSPDSAARAPFSQNRPPANGGAERKRHRFVQDGEVVVEIARPRDRTAEASDAGRAEIAETQMRRERATRERVEQDLRRAAATIQDWQTKHAHAEIHAREAQAALERVTAELQVTADALRLARAQLAELEAPPAELQPEPTMAEPFRAPASAPAETPESDLLPRRGRGRPRKVAIPIQENLELLPVSKPARRAVAVKAATLEKPKPVREPKPVRWWIKPAKD